MRKFAEILTGAIFLKDCGGSGVVLKFLCLDFEFEAADGWQPAFRHAGLGRYGAGRSGCLRFSLVPVVLETGCL